MFIFGFPNLQKSSFGEVLEAFLDTPETSWAILARLGRVWGMPWVRPGVSEGVLKASWGNFEASWVVLGRLGRISERFGGVLEAFWEHFGSIFGRFSVILNKI